jgi:phage-related tail fiber protein
MPKTTLIRKQVTPIGSIQPYGGGVVPDGWMACDGSPISRSTYSNLFLAIGTSWGVGDGSTTFNLPDLRGRFLRGTDDTSGNDPDSATRKDSLDNIVGDVVGSLQEDAIRNITGSTGGAVSFETSPGTISGVFGLTGSNSGGAPNGDDLWSYPIDFDASRVVPTGADNRPTNAAVKYVIKVE